MAATYTVIQDDSLWKIAEKVYGDPYEWSKIAQLNKIPDPYVIYAGQVLLLPGTEGGFTATPGQLNTEQQTQIATQQEVQQAAALPLQTPSAFLGFDRNTWMMLAGVAAVAFFLFRGNLKL